MKNQKKKAFTLAELLVVVLIVGVLSTVAVPKMKSVIETRRTTEAEDIMTAVRTEQEKRCVLGKQYLMDSSKVDALANASNSTNYSYALDTTGIVAQSKGKDYNLQIRSYKTGEICCQGEYCASLNKNYPSCDSIAVLTDECAGVAPNEPPQEPEIPEPTPEPESPCAEPKPEDFYVPCGPCGRQLMVYSCQEVNAGVYAWIPSGQGCELTPADSPNECTPGASESQSCGANSTKTRTCSNTCAWGEWSSCQGCQPTKGESYSQDCPNAAQGKITFNWNYSTCEYEQSGSCVCAPNRKGQSYYAEECTGGKTGKISYTWDFDQCKYIKKDECTCPNGERSDGTCKQPVYTYQLVSKSAQHIFACDSRDQTLYPGCENMTPIHCRNFKIPSGGGITYPAGSGGKFCSSITCSGNNGTQGQYCIVDVSLDTGVPTKTCVYLMQMCDKVVSHYE